MKIEIRNMHLTNNSVLSKNFNSGLEILINEIPSEYKYISWYLVCNEISFGPKHLWVEWPLCNILIRDNEIMLNTEMRSKSTNYISGKKVKKIESDSTIKDLSDFNLVIFAHEDKLNLRPDYTHVEFIEMLDDTSYASTRMRITSF